MSMHKKASKLPQSERSPASVIVAGAGLVAAAMWTGEALAQDPAPAPAPAGGDSPGGAPAADNGAAQPGGEAPAPSPGASQSTVPPIFGAVAPPPAGVPIGGGNNTESSAQPVSGDREDHFDYGGQPAGGTVHGDKGGYAYLGSQAQTLGEGLVPDVHVVRRGDTLWGLCDSYFHNPYQWPRIWSYNPQLQNPHWIYPGDRVRMRVGGVATGSAGPRDNGNMIERRRTVLPETIFLRDEGYVEDEAKENWGELTGAPEERIFLSDLDEVYLHISNDHDVKIGDELTVYRPTRSLGTGQIVQIQGTVRIDDWDVKTRVARGRIVETLDTIERGARVGPVGRRFDVVAPVRNEADLTAQIMASVKLHAFFGQNQVVFVDKGADDGLKVGNRLFVMRRGDAWRQTLVTDTSAMRISVESASPADMEHVRRARDESKYPQEVTAELRVLSLHQHSATCIVTQSLHEIELGELAVARRGY